MLFIAVRNQKNKLISPQPRQRHGVIKAAVDSLRTGDQQLIADVMSPGIVNDFEAIEVDEYQSKLMLMQFGMLQTGL